MTEDTDKKTNSKQSDEGQGGGKSTKATTTTRKKSDSSSKKNESTDKSPNRSRTRSRRSGSRRDDYDSEVIDVRRVTRVIAGGRRFSFRVAAVAGNHKGKVGVGMGKANDISDAIGKAINRAKQNAIKIEMTEENSIPHKVSAKYNASEVEMYPAPGRGLVSGSSVRDVVRLAGLENVSTKLISRTKNKLNNARAAIEALKELKK